MCFREMAMSQWFSGNHMAVITFQALFLYNKTFVKNPFFSWSKYLNVISHETSQLGNVSQFLFYQISIMFPNTVPKTWVKRDARCEMITSPKLHTQLFPAISWQVKLILNGTDKQKWVFLNKEILRLHDLYIKLIS